MLEKPILLIVNRAFLVSQLKYQRIKIDIALIIHDECHSIKNKKTTREFYNFMLKKNNISCIGFSATPELKYKPFNNVLSNYSIYDAYCDKVIVKPCIKWINTTLNDTEIIFLCANLISQLKYKKIVIWCGLIDACIKTARLWKKFLQILLFHFRHK